MIDCKQHTDIEVIRLAIDESTYFVCLYDKYQDQFLRYIHRLSNVGAEDAEDILQEAFVKIWRNIHSFDADMKFSTWAYRIVHNETVSFWRKQKKAGTEQILELEESDGSVDVMSEESDSRQKEAAIQQVLSKLSPDYKAILVLRYFEHLDYEEISDVLKIPMGTVATRVNRAKKRFAKVAVDKNIKFFET